MIKISPLVETFFDHKAENKPNKTLFDFKTAVESATNYPVVENNPGDRQCALNSILEPRELLFSDGKKIIENHQKSEVAALKKVLFDNPQAKINSEALIKKLKYIQAVELIYTNAISQINKVTAAQISLEYLEIYLVTRESLAKIKRDRYYYITQQKNLFEILEISQKMSINPVLVLAVMKTSINKGDVMIGDMRLLSEYDNVLTKLLRDQEKNKDNNDPEQLQIKIDELKNRIKSLEFSINFLNNTDLNMLTVQSYEYYKFAIKEQSIGCSCVIL